MKNHHLTAIVILAPIILQCGQPADRKSTAGDTTIVVEQAGVAAPDASTTGNSIQTAMFLEQVALMIKKETEWGRLAREKAESLTVRNFGKASEEELSVMKSPLNAMASARGLKLPDALPAKEQQRLSEMSRMEKKYFDRLYLKMALEDYRKNIELFKGAIGSPDTVISNFARRYLPILEKRGLQALDFSKR